ncbi:hypothetical protein NV377_06045 [Paenibacillus sp. T3-5-0-4]|nr:hypothetical protein [Paenibacillus endoradicis]
MLELSSSPDWNELDANAKPYISALVNPSTSVIEYSIKDTPCDIFKVCSVWL